MPSTISPHEFVAKWRHATLKERAAAQSHFNDLCALIGHPTPTEADPDGSWFTFERGAGKATGGQGWADVWKRGCFGWEYKGKHANLDRAYAQLLLYSGALENPPLLIVCDIDMIRIHTHFTNTVRRTYTLTLDDLLTPEGLDLLRRAFTDPEGLRAPQTTSQVTEAAAERFARLAELLRASGGEPLAIAHFLIRLLFCLFAEDAGILPQGLFTRLVTRPQRNTAAFTQQLRQLFGAMTSGGFFGADEIPRVNGSLFNDDQAMDLGADGLRILAEVSTLDWAAIEPAILGTLFERGLDPGKRSQLGAHFTSKEDILLIVEPVLMAPLRRRWAEVRAQAQQAAARRDAAPAAKRPKLERELFGLLRAFREELAAVTVLDPACGSGNFLYIALRLLLDLEKEVIGLAADLGDTVSFPLVSPAQLHGIEINPYASELAQATIWIGYIQWLRENGFGLPGEPILKPLEAIRRMDAILAYDEQGRPVEPEWPAANVIVGNPPFLGGKRLRSELTDGYVDDLFALYEGRVPREADLVCYWFEKARASIQAGGVRRAGLLATQGIRGGANRRVLVRIKETGDIFWAQSDRDWILDGAAVHVSMVGFDDGSQTSRELDGKEVGSINANLTAAVDLTLARRLPENGGLSFMGVTPAGPFDIPESLAREWMASPLNPNGRPNSDVLRPYYNGIDLTRRPRGVWIVDFGVGTPLEQAALYEGPFEYVLSRVKPKRMAQRSTISEWWLHERPRPDMRAALQPFGRYIGTSMVSKHLLFSWIPAEVTPANLLIVVARDDDYFFGVLHSKLHELWARAMGTQLREVETGFRYTPTTTFETFPFPWPPGKEPAGDPRVEAIAAAACELVEKRDAWLNPPGASETELKKRTLTHLYNQRPMWLELAHGKLDAAVFVAYGWPPDLSGEEILARLLALNLERAEGK